MQRVIALVTALTVATAPVHAGGEPVYRYIAPGSPTDDAGATPPVGGTNNLGLQVRTPAGLMARTGSPVSRPFIALGARGDVRWALSGAALPQGLALSPDGILQGTATVPSVTDGVVVTATDAAGRSASTRAFRLTVAPAPWVSADSRSVAAGAVAEIVPGSGNIIGPASWSLDGTPPAGLSLDPATGRISGVPEQAGAYAGLSIQVTDSDGAKGSSGRFTIQVSSPLSVTGVPRRALARAGRPITAIRPAVSGNVGTVTWDLSPSSVPLPEGLALDPATGTVSGIPATEGTTDGLILRATDVAAQVSLGSDTFAIEVHGAPEVSVESVYGGRRGGAFAAVPSTRNVMGEAAWSLTGGMPFGIVLDPATGRLSGSLSEVGSRQDLRLGLVDLFDGAQALSVPFDIEALEPLGLSLADVPDAQAGSPFAMSSPSVHGLRGAPTFALRGMVPPGLSVDPATGVVAGLPTEPGAYAFEVGVTDASDQASAWAAATVSVGGTGQPQAFAANVMAGRHEARVDVPFSLVPAANGASGPVTWKVVGDVPAWLSFDPFTGALSGTPSEAVASPPLTLVASDGGREASTSPFYVDVLPAGGLSVSLPSLLSGLVGVPFSGSQPSVAGARGGLAYALSSGAVPDGLVLDPSTGILSGSPATAGDHAGLVLSVRDASDRTASSAPFTVRIEAASPTPGPNGTARIEASMASATGEVMRPLSATPSAHGLSAPVSWSLAEGALPDWAGLDPATGQVSGTPTRLGSAAGLVLLARGADGAAARTNAFALSVVASPTLGASMPDIRAASGRYVSALPSASGARGAVDWNLASGTLPDGLSVDPATGEVAGTPREAGTFANLSLQVRDESGSRVRTNAFAVGVSPTSLQISGAPTGARVHVGRPLATAAPAVTGNAGQVTWTLLGSYPSTIGVSADGGLRGTPTATGTHRGLVLVARDAGGASAASQPFDVTVVPELSATARDAVGRMQATFQAAPAASDAIGPVAWSKASGPFPGWMTLDPATGAMGGTPDAEGTTAGLVLAARDASGSEALAGPFSVTVSGALVATAAETAQRGRVGVALALPVPTSNAPVTWSAQGSVPAWLATDPSTGAPSGTPTEAGTWTYTLSARDASGFTARTAPMTLVVAPAPTVAIAADQGGRANAPWSASPSVTGAAGTQSWSLAAGTLPGWATLDPATGTMSGTPTANGITEGLRLRVVDSEGATGTGGTFAIRIRDGIAVTGLQADRTLRVGLASQPQQAAASGAAGTIAWSVSGLPEGLSLTPAGMISGTPAKAGAGTYGVTAVDASDGARASAQTTYTVIPAMQAGGPDAALAYHVGPFAAPAPRIVGQRGKVSWRLAAGAVPGDAVVDPDTGILSGTAPAGGLFKGIVLSVTDSFDGATARTEPFDLRIVPTPSVAGIQDSYAARSGLPFAMPAPEARDTLGQVRWSWSEDSPPPAWASLDPATGVVSGTPPAQGATAPLRLVATDATGAKASSVPFRVTAYAVLSASLDRTTYTGRLGTAIAANPVATGLGGTPTWSLAVVSGALPDGIAFDAATGSVRGAAKAPGSGVFRVTVSDPSDGSTASTPDFRIDAFPTLTLSAAAGSVSGHSGTFLTTGRPSVSGLVGAGAYSVANVPPGLTVDDAGVVSGIPDASDGWTATATLTLVDGADNTRVSDTVRLTVLPPFQATHAASLRGRAGTDLSSSTPAPSALNATPGGSVAWELAAGTLPTGARIDPASGRLTGPAPAGTYPGIRIKATDGDGATATTPAADLVVAPALAVDLAAVPASATELDPYAGVPAVAGLVGTPTWSVANAPAWMSVATGTGRLTGTPPTGASAPASPIAVSVRDSWDGTVATAPLSLAVAGVPVPVAAPQARLPDQTLPDAGSCLAVPVSNAGSVDAAGLAATVSAGSGTVSTCQPASSACGTTLAKGATCSFGVRLTAASAGAKSATLRISASTGPSASVELTGTVYDDVSADPFTIAALTNQVPGARVASQPVAIQGITAAVPASVSGPGTPLLRVAGGAWSASGTVSPGQSVEVQATAPAAGNAAIAVSLTVGGASSDFVVRTGNPSPSPFAFPSVAGATPGAPVASQAVGLAGMTVESPVAVSAGGAYAVRLGVNGATPTATIPATVPSNAALVLSLDAADAPDGSVRTATVTVGGVAGTWSVATVDTKPDAFAFADLVGVPGSQVAASAAVTPVGFSSPAPVSVGGEGSPEVSVAGGAWGPSATLSPGQSLQVRLTAAATENGTPRTATVTVGGVQAAWTVSTRDTIPDSFAFANLSNQPLSTLVASAPVTVTGISAPSPVSVTGTGSPQVRIGGDAGSWTTSGYVTAGQRLEVRLTSPDADNGVRTATVGVGGVAALWQVAAGSATPARFSFVDVANAQPGSAVSSAAVTLTGSTIASPASLSAGGAYPVRIGINGATPTASVPATVPPGARIVLSLDAAPTSDGATRTATLTVNGVSATWTVASADTVPNVFAFAPLQGQPVNSVVESEGVTVGGLTAPAAVTVSGQGSPEVSVSGGAWTSAATTVANGQTVSVRLATDPGNLATRTATVTVGGTSAAFSVRTQGVDASPDAFAVAAQGGLTPGALAVSPDVVLTGYDAPVQVSATSPDAVPQMSIAGKAWGAGGTLYPGQAFRVRGTVGGYGASRTVTVVAGDKSAAWTLTARQQDSAPDPFAFPSLAGQVGRTIVESAAVQPVGYLDAAAVTVTGPGTPQVSIAGGAYAASGTIAPGQSLKVRLTTGDPDALTSTATVTVGGVAATFTATTLDTMPDIPWTKAELDGYLTNIPVDCCQCLPAKPLQGFTSPVRIGAATCTPTRGTLAGASSFSKGAFRGNGDVVATPGDDLALCVHASGNQPGDTGTCTFDLGGRSVTVGYKYRDSQPNPTRVPQMPFFAGRAPGTMVVTPPLWVFGNLSPSLLSVSAPGEVEINGNGTWYPGGTQVRLPMGGRFRVRVVTPASGSTRVYVYHGENADLRSYFEVTPDAPRATFQALYQGTFDPMGGNIIGSHWSPGTNIAVGNTGNVCAPYDAGQFLPLVSSNGYGVNQPHLGSAEGDLYEAWEWKSRGFVCPGEYLQPSVYPPQVAGATVRSELVYGNVRVPLSYTLAGAGIDGVPDAFAIPSLAGQPGNSVATSSGVTLGGFTTQTPVTVSGQGSPQVSVGGRGWTTSDNARPGEVLKVRLTTGPADGTTYAATVTAGGVQAAWSVTTGDATPDAFAFQPNVGMDPGTFAASGTVTVSGLGAPSALTVSGAGAPQVSVNAGGLVGSATVKNGDTVQVFATAPAGYAASQGIVVAIGSGQATWTLSTRASDTTPASFGIPARTNQPVGSMTQSASVRPGAYLDPAAISVTGEGDPTVSVDGGPWVKAGTIAPGSSFAVRLTSAPDKGVTRTATVTVGGVPADYQVSTAP